MRVCREMMVNQVYHALLEKGYNPADVHFQQDNATPHTAGATKSLLRELFGHVITNDSHPPWPPRSPDLSSCDFFLWGATKDKLYKPPNAPTTLLQLEQRIEQLISEITVDQLHSVFDSFVERCELCVRFGGKLSGWTGD